MSTVGREFTTNRWLHGFTTAFLMRDVMKISVDFQRACLNVENNLDALGSHKPFIPVPAAKATG
ncbi:MAG: hypothetical protein M3120_03725, partial [Pseudomonadota bacterium]|nr:hypothetical protein [Pseudomonadota bacterium]